MRHLLALLLLAGTAMGQARLGPCLMDGSDCGASGGVGTVTSANYVLAGPATVAGPALFRAMVAADLGTTMAITANSYSASANIYAGNGISLTDTNSTSVIRWNGATTYDIGITRASSGLLKVTDGSAGLGSIQANVVYANEGSFRGTPSGVWHLQAGTGGSQYFAAKTDARVGGLLGYSAGVDGGFSWTAASDAFATPDLLLTRRAAATLQLGAANSATPVAQALTFQGARGGTDTNVAGKTATITGSLGTGTASSGTLVFKAGTPQAPGTTQHVAATVLTLSNTGTSGTALPQATFAGQANLAAGSTSVAPLKFTSGPLLTTTQAGAVEFLSDAYYATIMTGAGQTSFYPPAQSGTYVKATTSYDATADPWLATDPTKSLIGPRSGNSWMSLSGGGNVDQRLHIDLGSAVVVTKIMYHNFHASGIDTSVGVKNFTFWGSNDSGAFSTTTYATDTNWTQIPLGTTQFLEHAAADAPDPQYIDVPTGLPYRYYAFKFADNYGYVAVMGVRRIELQTGGPRKGILLNDGLALTAGRIPYVTTNGRLMDSSAITTNGSTVTATGFAGPSVTGTDQAGGPLALSSGLGTGTGTPSSVVISTPTVGLTGSTAQVPATRLTVNSTAVTSTVPVALPAGSSGTPSLTIGDVPGLYKSSTGNMTTAAYMNAAGWRTAIGDLTTQFGNGGLFMNGGSDGVAFGASIGAPDTYINRGGAATLRLGAANSATPVAQTLKVQDATGTNTASAAQFYVDGPNGTGTGAVGSLVFRTGAVQASGTTAHVPTARLALKEGHTNLSGLANYADNAAALAAGLVAGDLYYTDTAGEYLLKIAH